MSFSFGIIDRTDVQTVLYLTCTSITSVDLAHYEETRGKDWVSADCGTKSYYALWSLELLNEAVMLYSQGHLTDAFLMRFQNIILLWCSEEKLTCL